MTMGEKIRELRKERGLTQKELGELCGGISDSNIRKYETDKQNPKLSTLKKIANALQVAPAELMGSEYYEKEYPKVFDSIKASQGFVQFLSYLGYGMNDISEPIDLNSENLDDNIKIMYELSKEMGYDEFCPNEVKFEFVKGKKKIIVTGNQFEQLKCDTIDFIEFSLWKLEQNKSK